jgi:hypothetical protein
MNNEQLPSNQEFPLSFNGYAAFDALSLKQLMKQRLTQNGVFTDQIFEGSNFNNLLDVVAYSYNVLLFYLNQTSNESLFSNAQLYENMNKIVKILNYKPVGVQSAILNFKAYAKRDLPPDVYTIPRFCYFTVNDIFFSFNRDLTFIKSTSGNEVLSELNDFSFLYQGKFIEHPIYVGIGEDYEEFTLVSVDQDNNNVNIDYSNIFVFVRDRTGYWREWERVDNIFLVNGSKEVFETRLNENKRYSLKFGNNVTGKKLSSGDLVAVYYLRSDKNLGQIGANTLDTNEMFFFNTPQYSTIMRDIRDPKTKIVNTNQSRLLIFQNENASIPYSELESASQIKANAPNYFKQQGRLVTTEDIKSYIQTNFGNLLTDVSVVNNWDYLDGHIRYLYNIGLKQPMLDSRVMYNQVMFADSCNFNNIYLYCVPKILTTNSFTQKRGFIPQGLKDVMMNKLNNLKMSTVEIVFQDPVYYGVGFGVATQDEIFNKTLQMDLYKDTKFLVVRKNDSSLNVIQMKNVISKTILDYFSFNNTKLGQTIDIQLLTQLVLNINGVESFSTSRNGIVAPGLSLVGFNTVYGDSKEDISIITQNTKLPYFKIPFWFDTVTILDHIDIIPSELLSSGLKEY